jgi:hypothetical protein
LDEVLGDLLVHETNNSQHLKDETTFTFLIEVSLHMVAMIDEINNLFWLNAILHGLNIGQQGPSLQQSQPTFQTQFGDSSSRRPKYS